MDRFLRALPYLLIMAAVVPVFGFLMSGGSLRAAWQYTKIWLKCIGAMLVAGGILALIILPTA